MSHKAHPHKRAIPAEERKELRAEGEAWWLMDSDSRAFLAERRHYRQPAPEDSAKVRELLAKQATFGQRRPIR